MSPEEARELKVSLSGMTVTLNELTDSVARIERGLYGDEKLKQPGVIAKVETLETKVEKHDRKLFLWTVGLSCIGALIYNYVPLFLPK